MQLDLPAIPDRIPGAGFEDIVENRHIREQRDLIAGTEPAASSVLITEPVDSGPLREQGGEQAAGAVAGLAAEAASTLRESDMTTLRSLAAGDPPAVNALLLSVNRLLTPGSVLGLSREARSEVLERMGLFAVRMAVELLRTGRASNAEALANELLRRSGLLALRRG